MIQIYIIYHKCLQNILIIIIKIIFKYLKIKIIKINKIYIYKTNKLNLTYLDLPIELKFKTRDAHNRQLKFSFGFKIGYELSDHTKYVGDDVDEKTTDQVTIKKGNIKNINNWNYGVTARVGKGVFNLMAYYSLSKIFNNDGPQMYPISVGISITPY